MTLYYILPSVIMQSRIAEIIDNRAHPFNTQEGLTMILRILFFCFFIFFSCRNIFAEEIHLKNGDRISGSIIEETDHKVIIETEAMGQIAIEKDFIKYEEEKQIDTAEQGDAPHWQRKASIGYSQTSGNTEASQGSVELSFNRKTGDDEWTGQFKAYLSTSNEKMDAKKFYGMGRYAYSFSRDLKWYNFYKLEADQDHFANIDYRFIPSTGIGYWFSDEEDWKFMAEGALGFEHTNYRDATDSDNEAILIPRGFLEKKLIGSLKFSEDITLYPSISEGGDYRLHSETALINPINDKTSWKVSFIDDYNSSPSGTTKKNDFRLISSIDYVF